LQGSSQTLRCGGSKGPKYVTLCGLGPADKLKVVVDWGASPLQALGSGAAAAAKAHKAKRVGVAVVGTNFSGAAPLCYQHQALPCLQLCRVAAKLGWWQQAAALAAASWPSLCLWP
jgi:hypothetical protein